MKERTLILLCALALAKAEIMRLNSHGCPIDVTNESGLNPNCNRNIRHYNAAENADVADPKQAPAICAAPGSDNTLIAHEHCNQFYQCWNGKPIAMTCYGDLQYNPALEICDWPSSVECGARILPEECNEDEQDTNKIEVPHNICAAESSSGLCLAHEYCNKFYKCVKGNLVTYRCPGNLLYNVNLECCDCACNVTCGDRIIPGNNDNGSGNGGSGNGGSGNGDSGNGGNGAGNCDPSQAPNICAERGSDGILVAHERCNRFYECSNGEPVPRKCPAGLQFNPDEDICDWPRNVNCGDRIIAENESEEDNGDDSGNGESGNGGSGNGGSGNGGSGNGGSGTCNCNPAEAESICSRPGSEGVLIAHENCNQFYICSGGRNVTQSCPRGLLYNASIEACDWPNEVNCGDRVIPENDGSGNGDSGNGGNGGSGNGDSGNGESGNGNGGNGAGNCDPSQAPNICSEQGSDGILVAHERCNRFYECSNGEPVPRKCPAGLQFNPYEDICDWPRNVNCGDRIIAENESEEDNGADSGNGESGNGGSGNGGSGNGGSGTCNCNPGQAALICSRPGSEGDQVAHENCNQFYICNGGRNVTLTCPTGLLYNPYLNRCDWPNEVDCGDRVIPENDGSDNGDSGNGDSGNGGNGGSGNGDSGNGESGNGNGGNGAGNCDPGQAPNICSERGSDGILVAHERCNRFYECSNGEPVPRKCPAGLQFNPDEDICDWPRNVNCGDRIIAEYESEEDNGDDSGNGESGNGGSGNGGSGNGGSGTCNCNPAEAESICSRPGSEGVLIAHENCNQFYICSGGRNVTQSCPRGLLYNASIEACDWPNEVNCGDRVIPENDGSDNGDSGNGDSGNGGNGGSGNGDSGNGDSGNGNGGNGAGNCDPSQAPTICSERGSDGILVAHERCNRFYECSNGEPVPRKCPAGLQFNPDEDICDWPRNVNCGDRIIAENESEEDNGDNSGNGESGNGGSENGGSGNGGSGTCNCNPAEAESICSRPGSEGIVIAHENCNQFYVCRGSKKVTYDCAHGLLYNPYKVMCDWPHEVNCGDRLIPGNGGSGNGDSGNGDSGNGGSGAGNCDPGQAPNICSEQGSDGILVAHERCNRFYECSNGEPVPRKCPAGLQFNPNEDICDWPRNVNCGDRIIAEYESEEDNGDKSGSSESENGGSGNGGSGTCNCNPGEAALICSRPGSEGDQIAHENCNQFYICDAGRNITRTCSSGLLYNPYSTHCDWPNNVDCGDRVIPENGGSGNGGNDGSGNGGSGNGGSGNGGSGTCNCKPGEAALICSRPGSEGDQVAHENCNQFYICDAGRNITRTCPSGLMYNPYSTHCDWPNNVDCGDRVIPENVGSDNSGNGGSGNGGSGNGGIGTCHCNPRKAAAICSGPGSEGTLIAHENCDKFYACVGTKNVPFDCPRGLFYNPYQEICDWPESVNCGDRLIPAASFNKHLEERQRLRIFN